MGIIDFGVMLCILNSFQCTNLTLSPFCKSFGKKVDCAPEVEIFIIFEIKNEKVSAYYPSYAFYFL